MISSRFSGKLFLSKILETLEIYEICISKYWAINLMTYSRKKMISFLISNSWEISRIIFDSMNLTENNSWKQNLFSNTFAIEDFALIIYKLD